MSGCALLRCHGPPSARRPRTSALTGPHAHLAQRRGRILRYPPEAVRLGPADLPEIVEFVARHRVGRRFPPRTLEMGVYLGIRRGGALVAMAGERLRPVGWTELSAVCTDPVYRRQGLATRLVRAMVAVAPGPARS